MPAINIIERIPASQYNYAKEIALIYGRKFEREFWPDGAHYAWEDKGWGFWRATEENQYTGEPDLVCDCGSDEFTITFPEDYETVARCKRCGRSETIHSG